MQEQESPVIPHLEIKNVSKTFVSGRPVLRGVTFTIAKGEICALAGANGSGKSTLVQILAGYHHPDDGAELLVDGLALTIPVNPLDARKAGIRFVHQDNGFIAGMSVLDNLCLGRGYSSGFAGKIKWKKERTSLQADLDRHNLSVDLDVDAKTLSAAIKAKLAIIRAMHLREGEILKVLVLDEPTAAMGREEISGLCDWLRNLAAIEGIAVLYIGHRPKELREVADKINVLRNGEIVAIFDSQIVSDEAIVEALVGTSFESFYPTKENLTRAAKPLLSAINLKGRTVSDISLDLHAGEIVGVTGLQGSGFEDIPYLIFDRTTNTAGKLSIADLATNASDFTISEHINNGIVLVPNDRTHNSVIPMLSVRENISQPRLKQFITKGILSNSHESKEAFNVTQEFGVTPADTNIKVGSLSGGNQQKVVMGKWLSTSPKVILLHEPTEGIDVMSKREIFRILLERAQAGAAILISSVEYEDLAHICDRILICGHGKIFSELSGELSSEDVIRACYAANIESAELASSATVWNV